MRDCCRAWLFWGGVPMGVFRAERSEADVFERCKTLAFCNEALTCVVVLLRMDDAKVT